MRASANAAAWRAAIDQPLLEVENVSVRFGGIVALDRISFVVRRGHIVGFIGPNGAGKTTMFNCLSRLYTFNEGRIAFEGRSLLETPPYGIASLGIGRTFQNLALFRSMSVRENVMLGGHSRTRTGYLANALRLPSVQREEKALGAAVDRLLALLDLGAVANVPVMDLPFGTQKRVELEQREQPVDGGAEARLLMAHRRQAQRVGEVAGARARVAAEHHVLAHAHAAKERQVLERAADAERGDAVRRCLEKRAPLEGDPALAERVEARQAVEHRRLAGAVRADEADDVAAPHDERDAVERDDPAEAHRDVLDLEQRLIDGVAPKPAAFANARTIERTPAKGTGALP